MDNLINNLSNEELESHYKEKEKSRKNRKAKQKSKEKLIISGQGHALIKRLEKEKFNNKIPYITPEYVKYTRKEKFILLDKCTEDKLGYYLKNPNKYKVQKSKYYEMILDSFEFERLYYVYLKILVTEITFLDEYSKEIISVDTEQDLHLRNGRYEYSEKWEEIFTKITGIKLKDAVESLNKDYKNIRNLGEPRKKSYKKKLKEYKELEKSSKILKKKTVRTKRRKITKDILNEAKSYGLDSEEFENLISNLPTKDKTEYLY